MMIGTLLNRLQNAFPEYSIMIAPCYSSMIFMGERIQHVVFHVHVFKQGVSMIDVRLDSYSGLHDFVDGVVAKKHELDNDVLFVDKVLKEMGEI